MHKHFKVLDSDIHIIEPSDLWQCYIDAEFRERAPSGLSEDAGDWASGYSAFAEVTIAQMRPVTTGV